MILADTSVWIDHFRMNVPELHAGLARNGVVIHPFVAIELALGSLRDRQQTLAFLELLPQSQVAQHSEVRNMIEFHKMYCKGIGFVDAHLVASCLLTPGTLLWTRDAALSRIARSLGILFSPSTPTALIP
jgi:hypothetical protein